MENANFKIQYETTEMALSGGIVIGRCPRHSSRVLQILE